MIWNKQKLLHISQSLKSAMVFSRSFLVHNKLQILKTEILLVFSLQAFIKFLPNYLLT